MRKANYNEKHAYKEFSVWMVRLRMPEKNQYTCFKLYIHIQYTLRYTLIIYSYKHNNLINLSLHDISRFNASRLVFWPKPCAGSVINLVVRLNARLRHSLRTQRMFLLSYRWLWLGIGPRLCWRRILSLIGRSFCPPL